MDDTLSSLVELSHDGYVLFHKQTQLVSYCNASFLRMSGRTQVVGTISVPSLFSTHVEEHLDGVELFDTLLMVHGGRDVFVEVMPTHVSDTTLLCVRPKRWPALQSGSHVNVATEMFFHSIPALGLSRDGKILSANLACVARFGWSNEEMVGRPLCSFLFPDLVWSPQLGREPLGCVVEGKRRDSSTFAACLKIAPFAPFEQVLDAPSLIALVSAESTLSILVDNVWQQAMSYMWPRGLTEAQTCVESPLSGSLIVRSGLQDTVFNLNTVVEDVVVFAASTTADVDVSCCINVDVPLLLVGNVSFLCQVLFNLLVTVVQASKGGEVSLQVGMAYSCPLTLHFEVSATSARLPDCPVMVNHLVEQLGGNLMAQSRLGSGHIFSFCVTSFCLDETRNNRLIDALVLSHDEVAPLQGLRLLVLTHSATTCRALNNMLRHLGCNTHTARSEREGLDVLSVAIAQETPVMLVLIDHDMSQLNGLQVAQAISRLDARPKLIALVRDVDMAVLTGRGFSAFCTKPLHRAEVCRTITTILASCSTVTDSSAARIAPLDPVPLRVLIVDDSSSNRQLEAYCVKTVLGSQRAHIESAANGEEALQIVTCQVVDVILMDVRMAGMNGIATTRRLRQLELPQPVIIIGVTGLDDEVLHQECKEAGMDSVLTKPLREASLRPLLENAQRAIHTPGVVNAPSTDLFDPSFLNELDESLRVEVIEDWKAGVEEQWPRLRSLCLDSRWEEARDIAHTMKGASAQIGASKLCTVSAQIEVLCSSGPVDVSALSSLLDTLSETIVSTQAIMK